MDSQIKRRYFVPLLALFCSTVATMPLQSHAATFVVDSTADSVDAHPGDGICLDAQGRCTLRAAIMEADALPSWDVIDLTHINNPSTPITLTIPGADESYEATGGDPPWIVTGTPDPSRGDLDITDSVTITGAGPEKTVIQWLPEVKTQPSSGDRIFHIQRSDKDITVRISGLTVQNGVTPAPTSLSVTPDGLVWTFKRKGAGIAIGEGSYMELVDPDKQHGMCGTEGGHGGGGHGGEDEDCGGETGLDVTLSNIHVLNNQSGTDGGGIYNTAPLTLTDSVISGNSAKSKGGGIYNGATLTLSNTLIGAFGSEFPVPNSAKNGGGMFDGAFHESHIRDSAFIGNQGGNGGGIAGRRRVLMYLTNSTISGNTAKEAGGGISTNGQIVMQNDTVADNIVTAPETANAGAGINIFAMGSYSYVNTLFSHNTLQDAAGQVVSCGTSGEAVSSATIFQSHGHNISDDATCHFDTPNDDTADAAIILAPLSYNGGLTPTRALSPGSPAVDAGDNSQCPNNDQRGSLRPASGSLSGGSPACDIGAYELFFHTADLHIEDVFAPNQVAVGDTVTLHIQVHNDPSATAAATGVIISTDPIPAGFQVISTAITPAGSSSTCTTASSVITCAIGNLGIGNSADVIITGIPEKQQNFSMAAYVSSVTPADPLPSNNTDHVHISAIGKSQLAVSTSSSGITAYTGHIATVPVTITNKGPDAATNLRLLVTFPDTASYQRTSFGDKCTYSSDDSSVLCNIGTLAAGDSISGNLTFQPRTEGSVPVEFSLDADQSRPDGATMPSSTLTVVDMNVKPANGGGGCVYAPDSAFDPVLPVILLLSLLGLESRRIRKG